MDAPEKSGSDKESEFGKRCHGVSKGEREKFIPAGVRYILFITDVFSTTHLADNCSKNCLVMFVGKMHRRALIHQIWTGEQ